MKHNLTHLHHILECIEKIQKATAKTTKRKFENSGIIKDGIMYNLQIMSESTKKISKGIKIQTPDIPWSEIRGFRNKLVHEYLGIDDTVVWNVVKKELPRLKKQIIAIIKILEK